MPPYEQNEEKARLRQQLSKEAVDLALRGSWEEAAAVNRDIVARFPGDVEAYNRLGRALTELGDFPGAREGYLKALELDTTNDIARKNLSRLANLAESAERAGIDPQKSSQARPPSRRVAPELFTAEMGKSGVVDLLNLAPPDVLAKVGFGYQVNLEPRDRRLLVRTEEGEFFGEVEPRHALRLTKLIEGGNKYAAAVLRVREDRVQLVIKEVYQHASQIGRLSFPVKTGQYVRPLPQEALLKNRDLLEEGEMLDEIESTETGYLGHEHGEEVLPEGFTVIGEESKGDDKREEFEL